MKTLLLAFVLFGLLSNYACRQNENSDGPVEVRTTESDLATIIRNPVSVEGMDTIHVAKLSFDKDYHNFGEIDEGDVITHDFHFTNTGKVPLKITNAHSTCGCTVPEYPKNAISPGEKGLIHVKFDSDNKAGVQQKPITITANTYPSETVIYLKGIVLTDSLRME